MGDSRVIQIIRWQTITLALVRVEMLAKNNGETAWLVDAAHSTMVFH